MTTYALIDGDIIVYQAGFASDQRHYVITDTDDDHREVARFPYKKDADAYMKAYPDKSLHVEKIVEAEPLENCLHSVKLMLENIKDKTKADGLQIYLTPEHVFRNDVDSEYKGNRDPSHKPIWAKEIKEYLETQYGALKVNNLEADDCLAMGYTIAQQKGVGAVICSLDKDLLTVPGEHYNWKKDEFYTIGEELAAHNFWSQMLMGDSADNIKGIPRIGKVKAAKLLSGLTVEQMEEEVVRQYKVAFKDDWRTMFEKNYTLLYILRDPQMYEDEMRALGESFFV